MECLSSYSEENVFATTLHYPLLCYLSALLFTTLLFTPLQPHCLPDFFFSSLFFIVEIIPDVPTFPPTPPLSVNLLGTPLPLELCTMAPSADTISSGVHWAHSLLRVFTEISPLQ